MLKVIELYPAFPFRFRVGIGKMSETDDLIHSDTLFSAFINCAAKLYSDKEVNALVNQFLEGKINISSVFYGVRNSNKKIFFFPKPFGKLSEDIGKKKIKKLRYLSLNVWKELIASWNGKEFNFNSLEYQTLDEQFLLYDQEFKEVFEGKEVAHIIRKSIEPKVQVQRNNNEAAEFYFQTGIELLPISEKIRPFLFFLLRGKLDKKVKAILNLLIEEGIGGERSVGKGYFKKWEVSEISLPEPEENSDCVSLSLTLPRKEEVNALKNYNLLKRDGFIYSNGGTPYRKKTVRLLKEGAIFGRNIQGKLIDVKPKFARLNHPVYVNGLSFNIKLGKNED